MTQTLHLYSFVLSFLIIISGDAMATKIATIPLAQLVNGSDMVVEGTVVDLTMTDSEGNMPAVDKARIGPGFDNSLELTVSVDHFLKNKTNKEPDTLNVNVWPMRHLKLESAKDLYLDQKVYLLLVGDGLQPISEPEFIRLSFEREDILKILKHVEPIKQEQLPLD